MTASLSLTDVLRTVVDAAVELSEADAAAVWLLRDQDGMEAAMTAGELATERRVFVYEDVKTGLHETPAHLRHLSAARSPWRSLDRRRERFGCIVTGHKERRRYSAEDIRLVERLSYQAVIAVANPYRGRR